MISGEIKRCHSCGHVISERGIPLFLGMVQALWKVWKWSRAHGVTRFRRKQIKHLFTSENETARFGDWLLFGEMIYRPGGGKKGDFAIDPDKMEAFFKGTYEVPMKVWKNPILGELRKEDYRNIHGIPSIMEFLTSDGEWVAEYSGRDKEQMELFK